MVLFCRVDYQALYDYLSKNKKDNLFNNELLREIIKHHYDSNKLVAAICASPAVILDVGCIS